MAYLNGEVIDLVWDGDPEAVYVKGHVHPVHAETALRIEYGDDYKFTTPVPTFARWSMEYRHSLGESSLVLRDCDGPGPGRFPVMKAVIPQT